MIKAIKEKQTIFQQTKTDYILIELQTIPIPGCLPL